MRTVNILLMVMYHINVTSAFITKVWICLLQRVQYCFRSELIVMHGDKEEYQAGIKKGRVEQQVCSWQSLDQTLGLNFCADYQFPAYNLNSSSQFIFNGPTKLAASLQKADPTAKKYMLEYKWDTTKVSAVNAISEHIFNPSTVVCR